MKGANLRGHERQTAAKLLPARGLSPNSFAGQTPRNPKVDDRSIAVERADDIRYKIQNISIRTKKSFFFYFKLF
jgi:hypothetical protein